MSSTKTTLVFLVSWFRGKKYTITQYSLRLLIKIVCQTEYYHDVTCSTAFPWASCRLYGLITCEQINQFIIWQGSIEVNPSVLICSYLVGILPYGRFPRLVNKKLIPQKSTFSRRTDQSLSLWRNVSINFNRMPKWILESTGFAQVSYWFQKLAQFCRPIAFSRA